MGRPAGWMQKLTERGAMRSPGASSLFPEKPSPLFTRASSTRSRLISIRSALTGALLSVPVILFWRWASTQSNSIWSTTPSVLAAAAIVCSPARPA